MSAREPLELEATEGRDRPALARAGASVGELDELSLARAARGDRRAALALVRTYEARVFALISRILFRYPRSRVDELAQEVFLRTFVKLPDFDPAGPAKLSTWILKVATRLCLDELRKKVPVQEPLEPDLVGPADGEAGNGDPHLALQRQRLREALRAALADLSEEQRAAFVLYEFHGQSYAEIAEVLAWPLGTVRSRLARARGALQARLLAVREPGEELR